MLSSCNSYLFKRGFSEKEIFFDACCGKRYMLKIEVANLEMDQGNTYDFKLQYLYE